MSISRSGLGNRCSPFSIVYRFLIEGTIKGFLINYYQDIIDNEALSLKERVETLTEVTGTNYLGPALKARASPNSEYSDYALHLHAFYSSPNSPPYDDISTHKRFFIQFQEDHPDIQIPFPLRNLYNTFALFEGEEGSEPYRQLQNTGSFDSIYKIDTEAQLILVSPTM